MPLTKADVDHFYQFATELVNRGESISIEDCVKQWCDRRAYDDDVAAIREAQEDIAAGRTKPAAQVEAEICEEFGLRPRHRVS